MLLKQQDHKISLIGGLILLILTLTAGISVFVMMQRAVVSVLSKNLEASLQKDLHFTESVINHAITEVQVVSSHPFLIQNLQLFISKPDNATGLVELQRIAKSFLTPNFTGLSIYDVGGHEVVRAGELSQKHDLLVPLKTKDRASLLWDREFILQVSKDILDPQGRRIGMVMTEAHLPHLTMAFGSPASIGKTGEFDVCAPLAGNEKNMSCFRSRNSGKVFGHFARVVEGKPLPMNHALNGETGIIIAKDYRREQVVAAHAPVGAFGLGMVIKIGGEELYQPITKQLKFIVPLLAVLMLVGILLLNFLMRPLVRKLIDSERATRGANILLRATEARFANIVNLAADAVISMDEEQRILIFNQGAERIFGYTAAEMLGQPLDMLLPASVADAHRAHIRRFATEPGTARDMNRRAEIHGRRKDGREFPAEASISKVKENGKFQFTMFLRDITERKQVEEQLRLASGYARSLIEASVDPLVTISAEGKITDVNAGSIKVTGIHRDELIGTDFSNYFTEPEQARAGYQQVFAQGFITDYPLTIRHADGRLTDVLYNASVYKDTRGNVLGVFAAARDVTAQKQAKEEIRQLNVNLERRVLERTTELQVANHELETFSYSVSHDLRAPLRSIDGFSQAVLEDYADKLDDKARDYLNRVRTSTQRMGHLIDDMLALSRVTRTEMRRETFDLSACAADVLAELQRNEPERRVNWHIESGLAAVCDERLLRVALVNLLGNAWKFTSKTANTKIEFGALRNADGMTEFFVRDNGAGYDMTYADKLFGAFQRLHLANDFPGTGIGLATVQRIVHRHGGRVWAEGAVGKGATFYFTL